MPKIQYKAINFSPDKETVIERANTIIARYAVQGFSLTLRQLFYQFVAKDLFPPSWVNKAGLFNCVENYNKLGDLISDARLAGRIDWLAIVDRGRTSYANQHWEKPSDVVRSASHSFAMNKWANQDNYVEVWVEKEALQDVLSSACGPLDVRFFACKGYTSQSAMWEASQRLLKQKTAGKSVHLIHLGDHDPSGIDMSRDIFERLTLFVGEKVHVQRIALNMVQVRRYNPPPNPAKTTDSRFKEYQKNFGEESWELDALDPAVLVDLINRAVLQFRNQEKWNELVHLEKRGRLTLTTIADRFADVVKFLKGPGPDSNSVGPSGGDPGSGGPSGMKDWDWDSMLTKAKAHGADLLDKWKRAGMVDDSPDPSAPPPPLKRS